MAEEVQPAAEKPEPDHKAAETVTHKSSGGGKKRAGIILLILLIIGSVAGFRIWIKSKTHVTTDNAFIDTDIHSISARIPGHVRRVLVQDNQFVNKGDLLVELDDTDYKAREMGAAAAVDLARNETSGDYAKVESARAKVAQAKARLDQSELDLKRGKALLAKEVIPKEQADRLETARRMAAAQLREEEEELRKEQAAVGLTGTGGKEARIAQRQAQHQEARNNLVYTKIYSSTDGYITRKSVETGNNIQAGQPLMAVVPLTQAWITANYKERQITHVRPGQKVEFEVDTYPGITFTGHVGSIMAGTGAAFSLLPPENATGNYVKVVQRIPVKIIIDNSSDPNHLLRIGMSVVPTILTQRTTGEVLQELNPFN